MTFLKKLAVIGTVAMMAANALPTEDKVSKLDGWDIVGKKI
jgi:hypothetical protein